MINEHESFRRLRPDERRWLINQTAEHRDRYEVPDSLDFEDVHRRFCVEFSVRPPRLVVWVAILLAGSQPKWN